VHHLRKEFKNLIRCLIDENGFHNKGFFRALENEASKVFTSLENPGNIAVY